MKRQYHKPKLQKRLELEERLKKLRDMKNENFDITNVSIERLVELYKKNNSNFINGLRKGSKEELYYLYNDLSLKIQKINFNRIKKDFYIEKIIKLIKIYYISNN